MRLYGKPEVYDMDAGQIVEELKKLGKHPRTLRDLDRKRELEYALQRLRTGY